MTNQQHILVDLLAGQSNAESIADRLNLREPHVAAMLHRLCKDGLVLSGTINGKLVVYRLSTAGIQAAIAAKPRRQRRGASAEPAIPV